MHDPVRFLSIGGSSFVKDESLSHANKEMPRARVNCLVPSCSLPEPCLCSSIGTSPSGVLLVFMTKEIPFIFFIASYFA